jgi:hypothetical protein
MTVTPTSVNDDWCITYGNGAGDITISNIMLNTGSTALPYEPYGYKIPIASANTTTPVYLGEVETTRKIKKLVLTGKETITFSSQDDNRVVGLFVIPGMGMDYSRPGYCNILKWKIGGSYSPDEYNRIAAYTQTSFYMSLEKSILSEPTFEGFITYLKQQYTAGTPVIIWYILTIPETGIVNEPLMKIRNYADEVSDITIPTIVGKNTFDVETTLKPSEASINYTGWHDTDVKEYISDTSIADWEKMSIAQMENHTIQKLQGGNWV